MTPVPPPPLATAAAVAERHVAWVERAVWLVLGLGLLAFVTQGANRPADPFVGSGAALAGAPADGAAGTADGAEGSAGRRPLPGFGEGVIRVTGPDGDVAELCALMAETSAQRQRGLMGQTDLRGYAGMLFRFDEPTESHFYMRNTLIPLTVAFFDAQGRFVSARDMEPCPDEVEDCPLYGPDAPYLSALEVAAGGLAELGIGPGAVLEVPGGGCPA